MIHLTPEELKKLSTLAAEAECNAANLAHSLGALLRFLRHLEGRVGAQGKRSTLRP